MLNYYSKFKILKLNIQITIPKWKKAILFFKSLLIFIKLKLNNFKKN